MPISIVTIQTFPYVLDAIREVTSLKDRTFAVIADEAHSSQTGAAARTLREVLTAEQIEEGEEVSAEDMMVAAMEARTQPENISFFAFTATPMTEVGTAMPRDRQQASLSEVVQQMNSLFEGELTDADLINYARHVRDKMMESEVLAQQAATNSKEQFALGNFHDVMMDAVIEGLDNYQSMADQVLNNEQVQKGFAALLLDLVYQAFQKQPNDNQDVSS